MVCQKRRTISSFVGKLFQRNSIYVATIFGGAFVFQGFFDAAVNTWYENHNRGKSWHDVRGRFVEGADEDDE
ncbi:Cytochrome b-c1 complex subunit 9 [Spathaspora sp. JA1]|nr:Cytochrome b-c1 complex subunit 9 [Spathaspora sp. JA1]